MDKLGFALRTCCCVLVLLNLPGTGDAKKILVLAPPAKSHLMQANSISEGLIARGYDVYTIMDVTLKVPANFFHPKLRLIHYDNGVDVIFDTPEYQEPLFEMETKDMSIFERLAITGRVFEYLTDECVRILANDALFARLKKENFDFVVIDSFMQCFVMMPHRLGVPFASFMSFLPVAIPHAALQGPLIVRGPFDSMLTSEDTPAPIATLAKLALVWAITDTSARYSQYSNKSVFDLLKESKLLLYDRTLFFDTAIPVSPNVIHVGGLNIRKPKPLKDGELKRFVDSASDGFILVTFGSFARHFADWMIEVLLESFADISYKIVWKWDKSLVKAQYVVPKNVLLVDWIPQNDVLGHPNIRLFVTHCGNSGQHEALYSGVPMLSIPLFGDQMMNAKEATRRGIGLDIGLKDLTKDELVSKTNKMMVDPSFSKNIKAASEIFRDQPMMPKDTAAYWIDHVIKYGADHLQSKTNDMPWYRILMWDVMMIVCVATFLFCLVLFLLGRALCRRCCGVKRKEKLKVT